MWKSPPTRQLSREKRVEYESDVRERFYDDYIGQRRSECHITHTIATCIPPSQYWFIAGQ